MPLYVRRRGLLTVTLLALGLSAAPAAPASAAAPSKASADKSVKKAKPAAKRCARRTVRGKRRIVCTSVRTFRARGAKRRDRTSPSLRLTAPSTLTGTVPNTSCLATASDASGIDRVVFSVDADEVQRE
jgi:hypothetical protein